MKMNQISISLHAIIIMAVTLMTVSVAGLFIPESAYAYSSTDIKTDEGVVEGYLYFDESNGAITDCDTTVTEVDVPEQINGVTVKRIASSAFSGCNKITRITLPASIEAIGTSSFAYCRNITEITIPASVTTIGDAFGGCTKLERINVDENNPRYESLDGVVLTRVQENVSRYIVAYPDGKKDKEYIIPDGVKRIYHNTFMSHLYLESVVITEGVESIGTGAFLSCEKLKQAILPKSLKSIENSVFHGCSALENVEIPMGVEEIQKNTFSGCSSLKSVVIPSSVEEMGTGIFSSCPDVVIYGEYGTCAEEYAIANDITFVSASGFRAEQTIEGDSSITRTYGCSPFSLGLSAKTELSYVSSNEDVAVVSDDGVVTVTGGGTAVITATAAQTEKYESAVKEVALTVGQASQTILGETSISKTYGCSAFSIGTSAKTGMTYKSSNTNVAEVSSSGKVTVKSGGTAIITVTAAQSQNYKSAVKKITLTVNKAQQEVSGSTSFSKAYGCKAFYLGTAAKTGMTYKSSNPDVAAVSSSGKVTVKDVGTSTITVSAEGTEKYKSASKKVYLTVGKGKQTISGKTTFVRNYGSRPFSLGAAAKTGLKYKSSNTKVATVSSKGKVTFKNPGKAVITITAKSSSKYKSAVKKVTVSSKLKTPVLKVKASKGKKIKLTWSQVSGATGYKIYIYDPKSKSYVCRLTKDAKVKSVVHKGLTVNKTYYYKVRAYRVVNGKNLYSTYSEAKKAKAKK